MGTTKAKTLIERHGFKDPDKGSPEHDKIQEWVYRNYERIITEMCDKNEYRQLPKAPWYISWAECKWEEIIFSKTKSLVGFIDLKATVDFMDDTGRINKLIELYGTSNVSIDQWCEVGGEKYHEKIIYFEIKTAIDSLGELLRQLNVYRHHTGDDAVFIIVSPDDHCVDILQEHGFLFYKYQPEKRF